MSNKTFKTIDEKLVFSVPIKYILKELKHSSGDPKDKRMSIGWKFTYNERGFGNYIIYEDELTPEIEKEILHILQEQASERLITAMITTAASEDLLAELIERLKHKFDCFNPTRPAYKLPSIVNRVKFYFASRILKYVLKDTHQFLYQGPYSLDRTEKEGDE